MGVSAEPREAYLGWRGRQVGERGEGSRKNSAGRGRSRVGQSSKDRHEELGPYPRQVESSGRAVSRGRVGSGHLSATLGAEAPRSHPCDVVGLEMILEKGYIAPI